MALISRVVKCTSPEKELDPDVAAWMDAVVVLLNRWYTGKPGPWFHAPRPLASQRRALDKLCSQVVGALNDVDTKLPAGNMDDYLAKKEVAECPKAGRLPVVPGELLLIMWPGGDRQGLHARLLGHVVTLGHGRKKGYQVIGGHFNHIVGLKPKCAAPSWALGFGKALRNSKLIESRVALAVDSLVTIAVLTTGRPSAVKISSAVRKFAAVVLASSLSVYFAHVETSRNPADKRSRRDHA